MLLTTRLSHNKHVRAGEERPQGTRRWLVIEDALDDGGVFG
jgi:hypothetical protein